MLPDITQSLCDPDEVPEPPDEPVNQPGEPWILGNHRLLCGDAGKAEDVDRLLAGNPVHLVNTDPPYNVRVEPRSNNAIAAGLSSFTNEPAAKKLRAGQRNAAFDIARAKTEVGPLHHQRFDVERHPEKAQATHGKLRPNHPSGDAHRPLPSLEPSPTVRGRGEGSSRRGVQPAAARLVRPDGPRALARTCDLHLGRVR